MVRRFFHHILLIKYNLYIPDRKTESYSYSPSRDLDETPPEKPEIKPKPILVKRGEKPKTLPKPKIPPKVAPKPNVQFRKQISDGGTEV